MSCDVEILAKSVAPGCPPVVSYRLRYPKQVHGEHLRHRMMSFSVSSGRAVPARKQLEAVRNDPAFPAYWGREQRGMSPGEPFSPEEVQRIEDLWIYARDSCLNVAEAMADMGVHKSLLGRTVFPWAHYEMVCTCCEPGLLNFFALRCSQKADPTIRRLAVRMAILYRDTPANDVGSGGYHAPYWTTQERIRASEAACRRSPAPDTWRDFCGSPRAIREDLWHLVKLSVARTGRVSYEQHGIVDRPEEKDFKFFDDRLKDGDWSVFEHIARAPFPDEDFRGLSGNLPGWIQLRQTLRPNVHLGFDWSILDQFKSDME